MLYFNMKQPDNRGQELKDASKNQYVATFEGTPPLDNTIKLVVPTQGDSCLGYAIVEIPCAPPNW